MTLILYINIMGQPSIVSAWIYSAALYVFAFACIIWGAISDKIITRFGRKKTLMLISGPILIISFIFIWIPPIPNTVFGQIFVPLIIWFLVFSLIFRIMGAAFQSSWLALLPVLSQEEQNRVSVSIITTIMMLTGSIISIVGPFVLMGDATRNLSRDDPSLFFPTSIIGRTIYNQIILLSVIVSCIFLVSFILMMIFIKEPKSNNSSSGSIIKSLKNIILPFKDKNYRIWLFSFFLFWMPFIILQYLLMNLTTFMLDLRGFEFIVFVIIVILCGFASFILWKKLSIKYGLKKSFLLILSLSCIGLLSILFLAIPMSHDFLFILGIIIMSFCFSCFIGIIVFPYTIMGNLIDSAESKTENSLSGLYSGAFTMVGSLGSATAMLVVGIFLEILGPELPISYGIIFLFGGLLIAIGLILFRKVQITSS